MGAEGVVSKIWNFITSSKLHGLVTMINSLLIFWFVIYVPLQTTQYIGLQVPGQYTGDFYDVYTGNTISFIITVYTDKDRHIGFDDLIDEASPSNLVKVKYYSLDEEEPGLISKENPESWNVSIKFLEQGKTRITFRVVETKNPEKKAEETLKFNARLP
jgi:hypothetical protein